MPVHGMKDSSKRKKQVSMLGKTGYFSLAGLFIPGFTIFGILGLQLLISSFGVECAESWDVLWKITGAGSILLPWIFFRFVQRTTLQSEKILNWLLCFNLLEYILIQASLASFFTNGQILCYANGGQNGLELIFTGWLAIPVLLLLSFIFQQVQRAKLAHEENE